MVVLTLIPHFNSLPAWGDLEKGTLLMLNEPLQKMFLLTEKTDAMAYGLVFSVENADNVNLKSIEQGLGASELQQFSRRTMNQLAPFWWKLHPDQYQCLTRNLLLAELKKEFHFDEKLSAFNRVQLLHFLTNTL